jgi:hypothetical protein
LVSATLAHRRLERLRRLRELQQAKVEMLAERDRTMDVFGALGYVPTEKQREFHDADEFAILYGGAAGGGKTAALTAHGIMAAVRYPGIRIGAFRRTYPEVKESFLAQLAQFGYGQAVDAVWNGSSYELRFRNGSLIMFRYAETLAHATRRQGGEYQLLLFDEVTLTPPDVVAFLESRLRSGRADMPVLGMRAAANPGGPGHGKIRERFIKSTDYGQRIVTDERGRTVRFIPSKLEDNPHVNPEYSADLLGLPEEMRMAMRDGNWDTFVGQAFTEFRRERNLVPRFEIPESWLRYAGLDYGWAAPSVCIWFARDQDGRVWVYRELTMRRTPELEQAKRILESESGERVIGRAADPAMWGKTGSALPPADQYATAGCGLTKGDNDRLGGKSRMHTFLSEGPACAHHRALGWATCPMLHILDGAAPELTRTLPDLPTDPNRPEDVDTDGEDHWYDALRYGLMGIGANLAAQWLQQISVTCPKCRMPNGAGATTCRLCGAEIPPT